MQCLGHVKRIEECRSPDATQYSLSYYKEVCAGFNFGVAERVYRGEGTHSLKELNFLKSLKWNDAERFFERYGDMVPTFLPPGVQLSLAERSITGDPKRDGAGVRESYSCGQEIQALSTIKIPRALAAYDIRVRPERASRLERAVDINGVPGAMTIEDDGYADELIWQTDKYLIQIGRGRYPPPCPQLFSPDQLLIIARSMRYQGR